ncbi:MAG: hypothetical protein DMF88_00715 [Acidobacteria bacterium]|nr:MAG: hypothetical protein DMF88_00715 [Acidobacteriota bacterium]
MRRWWRSHSVRVQLTLWYVAAMQLLDQQLRADFQWATVMVEQTPEGGITWNGEEVIEEHPWLQVWSAEGKLLFRNDVALGQPDVGMNLANLPDDVIVRVPTDGVALRVLSRRGEIEGGPVVIQVGRSEQAMREQIRTVALILLLGLPLAVATAGFGGYLLAGRALAPAEESFEKMRRFTADVSHELRTPLTAIRSVGEVGLRGGPRDEGGYRAIIGSMLEEVDRLAVLVDRLLTLSRAETGHARLAIESIDLKDLADSVVADLAVLAEEKSGAHQPRGQCDQVRAGGQRDRHSPRRVAQQGGHRCDRSRSRHSRERPRSRLRSFLSWDRGRGHNRHRPRAVDLEVRGGDRGRHADARAQRRSGQHVPHHAASRVSAARAIAKAAASIANRNAATPLHAYAVQKNPPAVPAVLAPM